MSFVSTLGATLAALGERRAWALDFEFVPRRGDSHAVVTCMAAHCVVTDEKRSLWLERVQPPPSCPFAGDELFIAHSVTAEVSCFIALGWPLPTRIIDTMVETARLWNGKMVHQPGDKELILEPSLLSSLAYFNIPCRGTAEKDAAIDIILRGGPRTPQEIANSLAYCMDDAEDAARLAAALFLASDLADPLRFRQAVWRGRNVAVLAAVEATGTPLDMPLVKRLVAHGQAIADGLVDTLGAAYPGVFREDRSLDKKALSKYLVDKGIPWPRTPKTGMPILDEKVRKQQVELFPEMKNLDELLRLQGRTRLGVEDLAIGSDGRNRTRFRAYTTKTSRCAPSSAAFIFAQSKWLRHLVCPPKGRALLVFDWKACEIAVAGALSGDEALWEAAVGEDAHIAFGLQLGQSQEEATANRPLLKTTGLGVQFGMTEHGIARRNKISLARAQRLLAQHKRVYAKFWSWSLGAAKHACEGLALETRLGWRFCWPPQSRVPVNATTARNWPVQSTEAEMAKLATCLLVEARLAVCAVVHDAFVVETDAENAERDRVRVHAILDQASEMLLGEGRRVRIKSEIIHHPDRYEDKDGKEMFDLIMRLLGEAEGKRGRRVSEWQGGKVVGSEGLRV